MNNKNIGVVVLPDKFNEFLKQCHNLMEDVRNHQNCREDFGQFELAFERHGEYFLWEKNHFLTCSCRFLYHNYLFVLIPSLNTQSCIRRPLCSTLKFENLSSILRQKKMKKKWRNKRHKRDIMQLFSADATMFSNENIFF